MCPPPLALVGDVVATGHAATPGPVAVRDESFAGGSSRGGSPPVPPCPASSDVPINNRGKTWTPETAPADWREQAHRWDRDHRVRIALLVAAFTLLAVAVAA